MLAVGYLKQVVIPALVFAAAIGLVFVPPDTGTSHDQFGLHLLVATASASAAIFVSVLLHELGHALAAIRVKVPVWKIVVFGITLYTRQRLHRNSAAYWGYVMAFGPETKARDFAWILAGGPLVSLALGAVGAGIYFVLLGPDPAMQWLVLRQFTGSLALFNLILLVGPLLTLRKGVSDQAHLLRLRKNPEGYRKVLQVSYALRDVVMERPREISDDDLWPMSSMIELPYVAAIYRYWRAMDRGEVADALPHLREAYALAQQERDANEYAIAARYEMAVYAARFLRDRALYDEALASGEAFDPHHRRRLSAIAMGDLVWGDKGRGEKELAKARKAALQFVVAGTPMHAHVTEWFDRLSAQTA